MMPASSHSHNINNSVNGFRTARADGKQPKLFSYAKEWVGVPEALTAVADRFLGVTIEQLPALEFIPKYASPQTLFYVDPPYVKSSRDDFSKGYFHEMSDLDHQKLAWLLRTSAASVIISGYDTPLYGELYSDWHREEKQVTANGQWGASARTEVLWDEFQTLCFLCYLLLKFP